MVRTSLLYCNKACLLSQMSALVGDRHQRAQVVRTLFMWKKYTMGWTRCLFLTLRQKKKNTLFMLVNNGYLAILHYRKNKNGRVTV